MSKSTKPWSAIKIVTARINLANDESEEEFVKRLRSFCKGRLQVFQIPQQLRVEGAEFTNARFMKMRR